MIFLKKHKNLQSPLLPQNSLSEFTKSLINNLLKFDKY